MAPRSFTHECKFTPFEDHNPPSMRLIPRFCQAVHQWLTQGPLFVAAVHCKAGKGRTGVMVCCYLLHASHYPLEWQRKELRWVVEFYNRSVLFDHPFCISIPFRPNTAARPLSAEQVMEHYAQLRTFNNEGVTIPSQRRYVHYYDYQLCHGVEACEEVPLRLISCKLHDGLPTVGNSGACSECFVEFDEFK